MSRPRRARERGPEISETAWMMLNDQPVPDSVEAYILRDFDKGHINVVSLSLEELWEIAAEPIIEEWAETRPGTRPCAFWRWSAPREAWMPPASDRSADPKPDPRFEREAAFLLRHGLLLDGELRRLGEADFVRLEAVGCD